ncbi:MAG: twin-arginine translocase TatA/TatE family subunit [Parcubacteria group bacterium]
MGFTELAIIVVLAVVVFFGGKKLAELSRSAGRASAEFKKGKLEAEKELKDMMKDGSSNEGKK